LKRTKALRAQGYTDISSYFKANEGDSELSDIEYLETKHRDKEEEQEQEQEEQEEGEKLIEKSRVSQKRKRRIKMMS